MYLEGNKWKNWHTKCSDVAIKENKDEENQNDDYIDIKKEVR